MSLVLDGLSVALMALTVLLMLGTIALLVQALATLLLPEKPMAMASVLPRFAVLVPAHNEEYGIGETVLAIRRDLPPECRVLVVADNCSDSTAERAANAGAEVVERHDVARRGKGYALAAGLNALAESPPEAVIFLDADCRLNEGGFALLARACVAGGGPVQSGNIMLANVAGTQQSRLAEFAWRIKNDMRPTGYARLDMPCQLLGTGMALPWRCIKPDNFATGHVTEDMLIGIELAVSGFAPRFVRAAMVTSFFPQTAAAQHEQKRRWMHGHLALIRSHVPKLAMAALRKWDIRLLAMAADILVPPLGLLAAAHAVLLLVCGFWFWLTAAALPVMLAAIGAFMFFASLALAWFYCGRGLVGFAELRAVPMYLGRILNAGFSFVSGRRSQWVRAQRGKPGVS